MIRPMDLVGSFNQEEMCIKENGLMTEPRAGVYIFTKTALHTVGNGSKTNNMATVMRNGLMELNIKEIILMV